MVFLDSSSCPSPIERLEQKSVSFSHCLYVTHPKIFQETFKQLSNLEQRLEILDSPESNKQIL